MKIAVYLSYAVCLVLLAAMAVPDMGIVSVFWFILYLLGGIFLLQDEKYRLAYFLANTAVSILVFIASAKLTVLLIGLVSASGFVCCIFDMKKPEQKISKNETIKKIISEVVKEARSQKKEAEKDAKVEVYEEKAKKPRKRK
jgi:membrane-bound ClpP family serine protease